MLHSHLKVPEDTMSYERPETFFQKYVSKNMPVVIRGGAKKMPGDALHKWNSNYFM